MTQGSDLTLFFAQLSFHLFKIGFKARNLGRELTETQVLLARIFAFAVNIGLAKADHA